MRNYIIFTQEELNRMKNGEIVNLDLCDGSQTHFMSEETYSDITTPGVIEESDINKEE